MATPDLVPDAPSRVVSIDSYDLGERVPNDGSVTFAASGDLHVTSTGQIIRGGAAGAVTVQLTDGKGAIRLPQNSGAVTLNGGSTDWVILVKKSWAPKSYPVRIPEGTSVIPLGQLPLAQPLPVSAQPYAITGVSLTVREADQVGGTISLRNGLMAFAIDVTPFDPSTVYPYIDNTVTTEVDIADARIRADMSLRMAWLESVWEWALANGYNGTREEWESNGLPTSWSWDQVTGKPTQYPPRPHTHAISDVVGLTGDLERRMSSVGVPIPAGADLDTYRTPGMYYQNSNGQAAGGANYPTPTAGRLVVTGGNELLHQEYTNIAALGTRYTRSWQSGAWGVWRRTAYGDELAKPDTGWTTSGIELGDGWSLPAQGDRLNNWQTLVYRVRDGIVYVNGYMRKTAGTPAVGQAMCRLPEGARPSRFWDFAGRGQINPVGQILTTETGAEQAVSFQFPLG